MQIISGPFENLPEEIGRQLAESSIINSPDFLDAWRSIGARVRYWMVLNNDTRVILAVAAVEYFKPMLRSAQFLADGLYFLPLVLDYSGEQIETARNVLWDTIQSSTQRAHVADFNNFLSDLQADERLDCETLIAEIDSPDWLPPDKKLQSEIRKTEREGLECEKFDPSRHLDPFMKLMTETEARHGRSPRYNEKFFDHLAQLSEREARVDWTIVMVDGTAAASHINLIEGAMLINWQVYYDKQFSSLKPNQYLLIDAIRRGYKAGVRRVNFGATPQDADGVRTYKEKWGGTPYSYQTLIHRRGLGRLR